MLIKTVCGRAAARRFPGEQAVIAIAEDEEGRHAPTLQAAAIHLGGVPIGAFEDGKAAKVLRLPKDHDVFYFVPVGHPR